MEKPENVVGFIMAVTMNFLLFSEYFINPFRVVFVTDPTGGFPG
jgi:hypothetical protein